MIKNGEGFFKNKINPTYSGLITNKSKFQMDYIKSNKLLYMSQCMYAMLHHASKTECKNYLAIDQKCEIAFYDIHCVVFGMQSAI